MISSLITNVIFSSKFFLENQIYPLIKNGDKPYLSVAAEDGDISRETLLDILELDVSPSDRPPPPAKRSKT